jgi:HK97 family phage major capsid protein
MITALLAKRAERSAELAGMLELARTEKRELSDAEKSTFTAGETEVREAGERLTELDAQVRADDAAAELTKRYAASGTVVVEPDIYRKGAGGRSYFRDVHLARNKGDRDASQRLARHDEVRALTTTDGAGGDLVPPKWLVEDFVKLARPGRITANLTPTQALPAGTDSINIPKVNTGTAVAPQATQNTAVQNTDMTTGAISSPVVTIAGAQTVALQLIEQSPINIDEVILGDLAAAYAVQLNSQVLAGAGTGGTMTGITVVAGTSAVTYTSASPTVALLYSKLAGAIAGIHTARFLPPDVIIMHPRRWAYLLAASDTAGRPLVTPSAQNPMNALGEPGPVASQGYVGSMLGLPVYVDALITTAGGGAGQDIIIVARMADLILWESQVRAEAFPQTFANNMSLLIRLYNYASFQAGRYPASIAIVSGTGLIAPTF